ncbi:hypothetical protein TUMEXPCC7403_02470 [Tumidithrix helvetica PCC 7403]|uniref:DUF4113 domain-containing protein n=1 Tax=Tumidithrix helvetica TaxID=3457545 RepID=UPI003C8C34CC
MQEKFINSILKEGSEHPFLFRTTQDGYKYKKCGVILSELSAAESVQLDLLSKAVDPHDEKLMAAMDSLNARFGTGAIKFASEGLQKPWAMKRDMRSPRYTSRWDELPIAKA